MKAESPALPGLPRMPKHQLTPSATTHVKGPRAKGLDCAEKCKTIGLKPWAVIQLDVSGYKQQTSKSVIAVHIP